ncbi:bifunctional [glutamine synthetase] adenylyltransferase/[glutamine synthetase]-adenylyl-L-tyrosine phosphorylase [Aquiluna sp. KACHI24]|uniref:bifunctional [glutamine synthetase] adenylyltransferase/[glutamine synthetase]-adenylyl-L-tyrosine phosphorylase n=1 Tax=Aquiluna sp. KACHI24 TaxID=2968831 RepID=UPI00220B1DFD|nr:bifunctional [glutamine synthetase] adenylyltransferase/[glutamine synthetase]-adenylyl-L-tyrosine phosphorylase [Aquiluna sp. KACHI24]BDQ00365.1 glutamate-ammonia-ligase adenylyltransferase [Aquiluna sp. KACHI24]
MTLARSSSLSELARLGFEELSETIPKLDELVSLVGDVGHAALAPISASSSPDRALAALIEIARLHKRELVKLLSNPQQASRLCAVLGASDGLADFIQRHPDSLDAFRSSPKISGHSLASSSRDELRIRYYQALLRIADFDLSSQTPLEIVPQVTRALSDLADGTIQAGIEVAKVELLGEGRLTEAALADLKFAVIAMGKTGARELNYLSDVDVIYVASGKLDNYLDTATKLATRLAKVLDEPSKEPGIWQLDPNLRPEGKQGALVRSLEGHRGYYEKWAEPWEFQALLKARFVAGDEILGTNYIQTIKPLIWSQPNRSAIVESARHLRKRVLDMIPPEEREVEIKLGRGGLRDVEFTAQLLQLVHGVTDESLRVMDTFSALDALADAGLLSRTDRDAFRRNYAFLRAVEHRVQLSKLRRTHLFPKDPSQQRRIARSLALSQTELIERYSSVRGETASLHDSVFYRPLLQATASLSPDEVVLSSDQIQQRLTAIGFRDAKGATQHIEALTQGVSRRAVIQRTLLPVLIRWMAEGTDPDRALLTFRRLSEELGETHWFLRMLRDSSGAAERLMNVLSNSAFIARVLESIPDSSQWFGDEETLKPQSLEQISEELDSLIERNGEGAHEAVRAVRRREYLRVAIGAVLGASSLQEISAGLTDITDAHLKAMLEIAKLRTQVDVDLGIVAMGRLGGRELGFGSDADCMLVYRGDTDQSEAANKLSQELLVLVKDSILEFELDLGLRPEGKNGPRVRSISGYQGYYERWAETWEFQALLRARMVCGSTELVQEFVELINRYRYPLELTPKQLLEIRRIKARVESERLPQGADPQRHFKLGRGSLSDIEWLIQLKQLQHVGQHPEVGEVGTLPALESLVAVGVIPKDDAERLREAWLLTSRCRSALVLAIDKQLDSLPTDRRALEAMARILEYEPGSAAELEEHYLGVTRRARQVFERLFLE